jgi:flagellar M-ring protein FliF
MKQLTELAESAVGFDASRGDQVSVEELAFDDNAAPPETGLGERILATADRSETLLRYGTVLVALLMFLLFVARPFVRALTSVAGKVPKAAKAPGSAPTAQFQAEPAAMELSAEQKAAEEQKVHAQRIVDRVTERVQRDPAQSTRLLESWIRSE